LQATLNRKDGRGGQVEDEAIHRQPFGNNKLYWERTMAKTISDYNQKILPQDNEAEIGLLGAVLIDEEVLNDVASRVSSPDFYTINHRAIYAAMLKLYEARRPIDILTLSDELKKKDEMEMVGGMDYLTELTNRVPSAKNALHYADIIKEKSLRRRHIQVMAEMHDLGYDEETPIGEVLQETEAAIFSITDKTINTKISTIEDVLSDSYDRLERLYKDKTKLRGIRTNYRDLDRKLAGLQKSDLIIIAARPAMGKTTLALNIAHNIAMRDKQAVLIFSLEMSKEQLVDRMLAEEAGVDAWSMRTGNLTESDFEKISNAMGALSVAPILIDDTPSVNMLEMRTKARRATREHSLGLIIVDYLQLMSSGAAKDNRVQEVSEISRGLKLLARELDVPVIALSQLSRTVETRNPKIPQLSDLRDSGSIEQDADVVMFIYREDYYVPGTERQHITDIIIAKHRNGPTGKIELYFHPQRLKFMTVDHQYE
jgi:replicative DNA helicase